MDRDFIKRQTLVWLERELENYDVRRNGPATGRQAAAASLANHLCNNWEQIQRAKATEFIGIPQSAIVPYVTRPTPGYQDTGNSSLDI